MNPTKETRQASWTATEAELAPRTREVVMALRANPEGLTAWELADRTHRFVHAVRPRLTELREDGVVCAVGTRWQEKTGRHEAVWRLVIEQTDGQLLFA